MRRADSPVRRSIPIRAGAVGAALMHLSLLIVLLPWSVTAPPSVVAAEKTAVVFQQLCSVCH